MSGRAALPARASPPPYARRCGRLIQGVSRVEPEHVHLNIVPERYGKHMAAVERLAHRLVSALGLEIIHVIEEILFC